MLENFKKLVNTKFVIAVSVTMISVFIISFLFSDTPLLTIYYFLCGSFLNIYSFGNMINYASTLIFASLGIALVFHVRFFNLGGEGQIYLGAFVTILILLTFPNMPKIAGITFAILIALMAGGSLCASVAYFKIKWNTNDLIGTYLLSQATILIINYFITGPLANRSSNLLTTNQIGEKFKLMKILPPSFLNTDIFFALIIAVIMYIYLYKTRFGYETIISGKNREFAMYGGIPVNRYIVVSAFVSGALNALSGSMAILGTNYALIKDFSSGMGFSAIAISLIAKNNPLTIIVSSLFFAYIDAGIKTASIKTNVTIEMATVIEALIFMFITVEIFPSFIKRIIKGKKHV